MSESKIQSQIIRYLQAKGGYVVKVVVATKAGVPDVIACLDGKFYGVEIKDMHGRLSALQEANLELIKAAGGYGIEAHSVEDVQFYLDEDKM